MFWTLCTRLSYGFIGIPPWFIPSIFNLIYVLSSIYLKSRKIDSATPLFRALLCISSLLNSSGFSWMFHRPSIHLQTCIIAVRFLLFFCCNNLLVGSSQSMQTYADLSFFIVIPPWIVLEGCSMDLPSPPSLDLYHCIVTIYPNKLPQSCSSIKTSTMLRIWDCIVTMVIRCQWINPPKIPRKSLGICEKTNPEDSWDDPPWLSPERRHFLPPFLGLWLSTLCFAFSVIRRRSCSTSCSLVI